MTRTAETLFALVDTMEILLSEVNDLIKRQETLEVERDLEDLASCLRGVDVATRGGLRTRWSGLEDHRPDRQQGRPRIASRACRQDTAPAAQGQVVRRPGENQTKEVQRYIYIYIYLKPGRRWVQKGMLGTSKPRSKTCTIWPDEDSIERILKEKKKKNKKIKHHAATTITPMPPPSSSLP